MTLNCPDRNHLNEAVLRDIPRRQSAHPQVDCHKVYRYGGFVGSVIDCHPFLPRAMDYARTHISEVEALAGSVSNGMIILADTMSQSKGRFTRAWHAPEGEYGVALFMPIPYSMLQSGLFLLPLVLPAVKLYRRWGATRLHFAG